MARNRWRRLTFEIWVGLTSAEGIEKSQYRLNVFYNTWRKSTKNLQYTRFIQRGLKRKGIRAATYRFWEGDVAVPECRKGECDVSA